MEPKLCADCDNTVQKYRTFCDECNVRRKKEKQDEQTARRTAERLAAKKVKGHHVDLSKWTQPLGSKRRKKD